MRTEHWQFMSLVHALTPSFLTLKRSSMPKMKAFSCNIHIEIRKNTQAWDDTNSMRNGAVYETKP